MTVEEIFAKISQHMVEGLMIHSQMSDYYNFLGLEGYSKCHLYRYHRESNDYKELNEYYIKNYNRIIPEGQNSNPNVIPQDWYKYNRQQVDIATRKNAIQAGFKKWVDWEYNTKITLQQMYQELVAIGEIAGAIKVKELIEEVAKEYSIAYQEMIEVKAIDYDITIIMEKQDELKDSYCKKIKKLFMC